MNELSCRNLLIGVTGSVGAVMMPQFMILLRKSGVQTLRVLMSSAACRFIPPYTMRLYSGHWVYTDGFRPRDGMLVPHIELTRAADLFVVMPASADMLAKAAHGICDDLISTAIVAARCPILFVPSMNEAMWSNRLVQRNVAILREHGYAVLEPTDGYEICDLQPTYGCMPPMPRVVAEIERLLGAGARFGRPPQAGRSAAACR